MERLSMKYTHLGTKAPKWANTEAYQLAVPSYKASKERHRLLFVIEHVPTEDLTSKRLLSGPTGELFSNIVRMAMGQAGPDYNQQTVSWLAVPWNLWRTYDSSSSFRAQSEEYFQEVLERRIAEYEPDNVVIFGYQAFWNLFVKREQYLKTNFYGVPFRYKGKHAVVCTLPLYRVIEDNDARGNGPANLIGYMIRNVRNGLLGKNPYKINARPLNVTQVKTLDQVDAMLCALDKIKSLAVDTETDKLGRVSNKMLTIQFGTADRQWFLPFLHRENPWTGVTLEQVKERLCNWFETGGAKYHIMHHGQFDVPVICNNLGVRYYRAPIWDTSHGEYLLDENMTFLQKLKVFPIGKRGNKSGYYTLENVAAQYSYFPYVGLAFGKADRVTIADVALDQSVVDYTCYDIQAPYLIHEKQKQRAVDMKYDKYLQMQLYQESDKVHSFATMGLNGIPADINYLMKMPLADSVISREVDRTRLAIYESKAAKKLNLKLLKEEGQPAQGIWDSNIILDIDKPEHKIRLFIEQLGLEPLSRGKSGAPSIGKDFKAEYADVPEVQLFSELEKAKKLQSAFVNSFLNVYREKGDIAIDHHIRPSFSAVDVVTGRISERDPNMQQIPGRSKLAYAIKRIFASEEGTIFCKSDYVSHEVRGWALVANDKVLGEVFAHGLDLRIQYQHNPNKELAELIFLEGDVHRLNVVYFFRVDLKKQSKADLKKLRDQIKGVIFGLIYGKGPASLSNDLGIDEAAVNDLVNRLFARFKMGAKWLVDQQRFARAKLYVESPIGRRRNLYHYLVPESAKKGRALHSAADRKARNSPIQGVCSDFNFTAVRALTQLSWLREQETGERPLWTMNVVHDSQENRVRYSDFWWSVSAIKRCMTEEVQKRCHKRFAWDFIVPLEIDMEFGPDLANQFKWEWDVEGLMRGLAASALIQEKRGHTIEPVRLIHRLFERKSGYAEAPDFVKQQIKTLSLPSAKELVASVKASPLFREAFI